QSLMCLRPGGDACVLGVVERAASPVAAGAGPDCPQIDVCILRKDIKDGCADTLRAALLLSLHLHRREGEAAAAATLHRLLGLRPRGPTAVSASLIRRFVLCFCVGSGVPSGDCASGAGSVTGSAVPSINVHRLALRHILPQRSERLVQLLI